MSVQNTSLFDRDIQFPKQGLRLRFGPAWSTNSFAVDIAISTDTAPVFLSYDTESAETRSKAELLQHLQEQIAVQQAKLALEQ